jgi:hypothetical protein
MPSLKSENAPLPPRASAFDSLRQVDILGSKVYINAISSLVRGWHRNTPPVWLKMLNEPFKSGDVMTVKKIKTTC